MIEAAKDGAAFIQQWGKREKLAAPLVEDNEKDDFNAMSHGN